MFVPRGVLHRFKNGAETPARLLVLFAPAGFDEFFFQVGRPAEAGATAPPLGPEEIARTLELAPRYGLEFQFPAGRPT